MSSTTTTTTTQQPSLTVQAHDAPSGPVDATLYFFKDPEDGSAPFNYTYVPPEGQARTNVRVEDRSITIQDIRDQKEAFAINDAGFQTIPNVSSALTYEDWEDDATVEKKYYPEVEKLLLESTGAKRIHIFDHTIRRTRPDSKREPVQRTHIDQTTKSAFARVPHHLPDEAEELLKDRVRLINVWRPLIGPIQAFPLAMADSRTVPESNLVASAQISGSDRGDGRCEVRRTAEVVLSQWHGNQREDITSVL